eukprot:6621294-Alexandrium_andersonii.AAC.1
MPERAVFALPWFRVRSSDVPAGMAHASRILQELPFSTWCVHVATFVDSAGVLSHGIHGAAAMAV